MPVGNPLVPDSIEQIGEVFKFLTDPDTWRKAAYYVGGAILIIVGAFMLAGLSTPGVKDVVKVATKVAKVKK